MTEPRLAGGRWAPYAGPTTRRAGQTVYPTTRPPVPAAVEGDHTPGMSTALLAARAVASRRVVESRAYHRAGAQLPPGEVVFTSVSTEAVPGPSLACSGRDTTPTRPDADLASDRNAVSTPRLAGREEHAEVELRARRRPRRLMSTPTAPPSSADRADRQGLGDVGETTRSAPSSRPRRSRGPPPTASPSTMTRSGRRRVRRLRREQRRRATLTDTPAVAASVR